ncbi:hypothetical protein [Mangrovibacterium diazotrophicum]|uniref:HEPN domain-containing protein n=1 Tax=Mangrovibacterium diazotrophicum TaxID=1261403 RepID=A0A419WBT1_9BACT|nr:hypothetical protein [Mangrovibacterium diazotrophicum]RKD92909.1 hypothetical protein BC643_3286 [Mangrovibacterium diazotrophicum]
MEEWSAYFNEGVSYYNATVGGIKKGRKFGNAVYYNMIGMALESLLTAAIMKDGYLPEHSSVSSMLRELKKKYDVPEEFTTESRFFNRFMNMCSLEVMEMKEPTDEDIQRMVDFTANVKGWTEALLEKPCEAN